MSVLTAGVMDALGWTLLHFLWQGALVAVLLWCALAAMDEAWARARYGVCCLALIAMVALPLGTFARLGGFERSGTATVIAPWVVNVDVLGGGTGQEPLGQRLLEMLQVSAPLLPWVWLAGVALCAGRLTMGLRAVRRMRREGVSAVEDRIAEVFAGLARRVGVTRAVGLLESVRVEAPTVVGWLKPVVLLPACCFAGMSQQQMEALLAHELAHIRRHDYLVSVLQSVVEALLFYHPAVWWVSRQVRRERECCCDDVAAEVAGDRLVYARALSRLEEQRLVVPAVGLGANGGVLHMRIRRVLGYREGSVASQMGAVAVLCVVVASGAALLVRQARAERSGVPAAQEMDAAAAEGTDAASRAGGSAGLERTGNSRAVESPTTAAGARLSPEYAKWLNEDVVWIIRPEEREEFLAAKTDAERDRFIKLFWLHRDDDPGVAPDSFRAQHYARVLYANVHFGADGVPGWKTDRGRVYIVNGGPESIEAHPSGGKDASGRQVNYPFEVWHYARPTVADKDVLLFVDTCRCGLYKYTLGGAEAETGKPAKVSSALAAPVWQRVAMSFGSSAPAGAAGQTRTGQLDGVIVDPTGALVPSATVSVSNVQTAERQTQQTDESGRYSFSVPAGRYTVDASAKGFRRTVAQNVAVTPTDPVHMNLKMQVGAASEYLTVSSSAPPPPPPTGQGPNGPMGVSGGMMAGSAVSQPPPVYPMDAKQKGIQGTVVLNAIISKTGDVEDLKVVSGPEELQGAALDAVKQWKYRPYLLNGNPVEVQTTIRVNFTFGGPGPVPPQPAPPTSQQPGGPLRVSAGVIAGLAISQPSPVYPEAAKSAQVQGVVVLHALVSKQGDIEDLEVVSGPQELTGSAIDAVRQWKYKPYLLNGEPVEVETTINVNYTLGQ